MSFESNGQRYTDEKADDVVEGLVEDSDDGGAETHGFVGSGIWDNEYRRWWRGNSTA